MAYPVAAGTTSKSGKYIPELWSMKLIREFYEQTCLSQISNTEFEGEIKDKGDKVNIQMLPSVTINDYVKGQSLTYEDLDTEEVELLIDKGKYWAFPAADIDRKQSQIEFINKWSMHYAKRLKIAIETDVLADVYADAHASNSGLTAGNISNDINLGVAGTPRALTKDNILEVLVDVGVVLDEQNIPADERGIVLPAWACGLLKKSDLKDASLTGDQTSILRNGRVGSIDRLTIYANNLLNKGADGGVTAYDIIACHKYALTFATQITKNERLRNQNDFGDLIRGLQVYGYETIKPEGMVHLYAYKG